MATDPLRFEARELSQTTVMVVEDDAAIRDILRAVLTALGFRDVLVYRDGRDALAAIEQTPPNLVITDWTMAPMDGRSLIREIRRASRRPEVATVPIVVLTAHGTPAVLREAMEAGANQFVLKPIVPQRLLDRVMWALTDHRPFELKDGFYRPVEAKAGIAGKLDGGPVETATWEID